MAQRATTFSVPNLEEKLAPTLSERQRQIDGYNPANRASSCGPDTILYVNFKRNQNSSLRATNIRLGSNSLSTFGQWYPAPSPVQISGVSMFGWANTTTDDTLDVSVAILAAGPDSIPTSVVYQEAFQVDTAVSTKFFDFAQPVDVTGPYVVAVTNANDSALTLVLTDPFTNDGRGEDLALGGFPQGGSLVFDKAGAFFRGGLDADFLIRPIVSYDFDVSFEPMDACLANGSPTTFRNTSSGVLFSRFYNALKFLEVFGSRPDSTFAFDFGDGSDTRFANDTTFAHTFTPTDSNRFSVVGGALYFGMSSVQCGDLQVDTFEVAATASFDLNQDGSAVSVNSNTLDSVVYDYGDGSSTTRDTTHTYNQVGTYTVSQIAFGCGGSDTATQEVSISTASLQTLPSHLLRISPNPSNGRFTVALQQPFDQPLRIKVHSLMGQEVARAQGMRQVSIDLSGQAPGVYLLRGRVGDQAFHQTLRLE